LLALRDDSVREAVAFFERDADWWTHEGRFADAFLHAAAGRPRQWVALMALRKAFGAIKRHANRGPWCQSNLRGHSDAGDTAPAVRHHSARQSLFRHHTDLTRITPSTRLNAVQWKNFPASWISDRSRRQAPAPATSPRTAWAPPREREGSVTSATAAWRSCGCCSTGTA
jgi:hypothetical protein